jgi:hypothetical protein
MNNRIEDNERDVLTVILKDSTGVNCYGSEEEPLLVVYRDCETDTVMGYEILSYRGNPKTWNESLRKLNIEE